LVDYSFIIGADANRAGQLSHDLANHYAHGDNKHPQDLVSATETVQNCNGTAAANTDGGRNNNREQHQTNNVEANRNSPMTQTGFLQRNNNRNKNQQNRGSGNNRPNHQQNNNGITCHACNQPGHIARNVHSSRAETIAASKIITDRCIFSKEKKVPKEIRRKTQKIVKVTFLMPHNCFRVSATMTTTFISRMKDHI